MISRLFRYSKPIVVGELVVLIFIAFLALYKAKHPLTVNVDMNSCVSDYASYEDGAFYFDETVINSESWQDAMTVNGISLPAGTWSLYIDYECPSDKMFAIYDGTPANSYLRADTGYLRSERQTEIFKFKAITDLDALTLRIRYQPFGYLKIKNISIISNIENYKRLFFLFSVFFVGLDIMMLKWENVKKSRNTFLGLAGLTLLVSLPMFAPQMADSLDLEFALLRIEGNYLALKNGVFPVKMVNLFLRGYGYPVSVFYGDLFIYIPAALRFFGFNITEAWKIYLFLNNVVTVFAGYICFAKISRSRNTAFMMTCLYAAAPFRLSDMYVRSACGELTALTIYPLIALAFYKIYSENLTRTKIKRYSTFLALGMSALICTHLLSVEMLCVALLLTAMVGYRVTLKKETLATLLTAIVKTVFLCAFFIVPFLDYYINVPTQISSAVANETKTLQIAGAYMSDWFSLYPNGFAGSRFPCSPGIILMMCLPAGVYMWANSRADGVMKVSLFVSSMMLALSSAYFPWDYMAKSTHIGRFLSQVQFPIRYVGVATLFLVILFGTILKAMAKGRLRLYKFAVVFFTVISTMLFSDMYIKNRSITAYTNTSTLNTMNLVGGEYVRIGTDADNDLGYDIKENNKDVISMEDTGSELIIEHSASTEPSDILVPRYNYKGYHVYDDEGNEYEIRDGINNLITFTPPENAGKLYVRFVEPWYWRVAEIISVLSLAAVSPSLIIKRKRRNSDIATEKNNDEKNEHADIDAAGENHDVDDNNDADDSNDENDSIKIAC